MISLLFVPKEDQMVQADRFGCHPPTALPYGRRIEIGSRSSIWHLPDYQFPDGVAWWAPSSYGMPTLGPLGQRTALHAMEGVALVLAWDDEVVREGRDRLIYAIAEHETGQVLSVLPFFGPYQRHLVCGVVVAGKTYLDRSWGVEEDTIIAALGKVPLTSNPQLDAAWQLGVVAEFLGLGKLVVQPSEAPLLQDVGGVEVHATDMREPGFTIVGDE